MMSAPHHLATQTGVAVMREGGNAIEAMVAAAATIAVVYPHMNGIGGDGFWLIHEPGEDEPVAIDACGRAGVRVEPTLYAAFGHDAIPARGPLASNTVAGAVSGWQLALEFAARGGGSMPLARLLEDAIAYARDGVPATGAQVGDTRAKRAELEDLPGFAAAFMPGGSPPAAGDRFRQPRLAVTLEALAREGLDAFYRGDLARRIAADLERAGSPLTLDDLHRHQARLVTPLHVELEAGRVYNLPPPTQGLASLAILGLFERLAVDEADGFEHVHGLVEATKQAFILRDAHVTDPARLSIDPQALLDASHLDALAARIDRERALPWPQSGPPGGTIWMGAADRDGRAVSFIQSLYWEFGSGVVLDDTGIVWQNRGSSFALAEGHLNRVAPGMRPFHTLNPALARLADGRVMSYGNMGGEGQPQTQAAVFTRHVRFGRALQEAVSAPRWLLGRTWGESSTTLKLESRFPQVLVDRLRAAGHEVEVVARYDSTMGHAGAVVVHPDGLLEGAADPRSDGQASGY
jgi:gamma-glutamyltranspeptidase/glutathione hydrolase